MMTFDVAEASAVGASAAKGNTNLALITGSAARVTDVSLALEKEGFSTYSAPADPGALGEELHHAAGPGRSLRCYVQLPTTDCSEESTASLAGLRGLVADALLARFDALAVVAPRLAPGARLVIVAGDRAGTTSDTDLGLPPISLVLTEAILARRGPGHVHTTVVGHTSTPADIAVAAVGGPPAESPSAAVALAGYAAASPQLSYVDWRDEVLGLAAELSYGCLRSDRRPWG
jgi:hypothetical protein